MARKLSKTLSWMKWFWTETPGGMCVFFMVMAVIAAFIDIEERLLEKELQGVESRMHNLVRYERSLAESNSAEEFEEAITTLEEADAGCEAFFEKTRAKLRERIKSAYRHYPKKMEALLKRLEES